MALVIYLYGDLAVYAVGIPTALSHVASLHYDWVHVLGHATERHAADFHGNSTAARAGLAAAEADGSYFVYLLGFAALTLPICFFNFQKSAWSAPRTAPRLPRAHALARSPHCPALPRDEDSRCPAQVAVHDVLRPQLVVFCDGWADGCTRLGWPRGHPPRRPHPSG